MKRILFLTYFFEPDLSAGSFRNTSLAKLLAKQGKDIHVDVITTLPNRYGMYSNNVSEFEKHENLTIRRVKVGQIRNGMLAQVFNYIKYYTAVKRLSKASNYDVVFASSSKLFTAYLGHRIAKRKRCLLYLDVRDIFVDTLSDVLEGNWLKNVILSVIRLFFERPTFTNASHVNMVSEGFKEYFQRYHIPSVSFFSNGIDNDFVQLHVVKEFSRYPKKITYAGNIGEGQGLEKIIPEAALRLGTKYEFLIIGDGSRKKELENRLANENIQNVFLLPPIKRKELIDHYSDSDFLFVHLNNYRAFEKVLPSKLFEYGATNLPIIAGVSGYAKKFIKQNLDNSIIFEPCNADDLFDKLNCYHYRTEERSEFVSKFTRESIMENMAKSIVNLKP